MINNPAIKKLIASGRIEKGMYWEKPWRLVEGCTKVSPGCDNCWSETQCNTRSHNQKLIKQYPPEVLTHGKWNGRFKLLSQNINIPLKRKKPTVYAIWNDLFYENINWWCLLPVLQIIEKCPQHIFIVLTKRPEQALAFTQNYSMSLPKNLWLGVSCENQEQADKRIHILLQIPAAIHFVSLEPLLGAVDLSKWDECTECGAIRKDFDLYNELDGYKWDNWKCYRHYDPNGGCDGVFKSQLDWVICGGESGYNARPMHPGLAMSVRDQCVDAGVPFFFKQWGEYGTEYSAYAKLETVSPNIGGGYEIMYKHGKKAAGRVLDGQSWDQFPEVLNV